MEKNIYTIAINNRDIHKVRTNAKILNTKIKADGVLIITYKDSNVLITENYKNGALVAQFVEAGALVEEIIFSENSYNHVYNNGRIKIIKKVCIDDNGNIIRKTKMHDYAMEETDISEYINDRLVFSKTIDSFGKVDVYRA